MFQNQRKVVSFGLLVAAVVCVAVLVQSNGQAEQPRQQTVAPTTVATMNLGQLFMNLTEAGSVRQKLETMRTDVATWKDTKQKELDKMKEEIDLIPQGSETAEQKLIERFTAASRFEAELKVKTDLLQREESLEYERMYRKILEAAEEYAESNNIDLVLLDDTDLQLQMGPPDQVFAQLFTRKVIYRGDHIDITGDLIARMNNAFVAGNGN